jgi:hypothetical protein
MKRYRDMDERSRWSRGGRKKYGNAITKNLQLKSSLFLNASMRNGEIYKLVLISVECGNGKFIDCGFINFHAILHSYNTCFMSFIFSLLAVITEEPEFEAQIENVTVPAGKSEFELRGNKLIAEFSIYPGRNVKLACSVKNLGSYKVKLIRNA